MGVIVSPYGEESTLEWFSVTTYGAKGDGTTDSTAPFQDALTAAIQEGGNVYIPGPGNYRINGNISGNVEGKVVRIVADAGVVLYPYGNGDCIQLYDSTGSPASGSGSGIFGATIDGTNSTGTGLHIGDMNQFGIWVHVRNFTGPSGIGVHFDNNYAQTEQLWGRIYSESCATNVMFDVGNSSGLANNSFDRMNLSIYLDSNGYGDGVTFNNGAVSADFEELAIFGNFNTATSQYAVVRLEGSFAGNYASLVRGELNIGVELDDSTDTPPYTIYFGSGSNGVAKCTGNIDFSLGSAFTSSNNAGQFSFIGYVGGDAALPSALPSGTTNLADGSQTISETTPTEITSLELPVAAFQAYIVEIYVPHLGAGGTGTATFALGGPGLALANLDIQLWTGTTLTTHNQNAGSATLLAAAPAASQRTLQVTGTIACGDTGTLTVTGEITSGGSAVSIDAGAYLRLTPVSAP